MQRRAAAVYFVFFLVIGAGAYSFLAVAQGPAIELDGETYSQGDSFTVDGRVPGVERFFKRNMDQELDNLEAAIAAELGLEGPLSRD